jgi:predicted metal-dependent peptidase
MLAILSIEDRSSSKCSRQGGKHSNKKRFDMSVEMVDLISQFRMMVYSHYPYLAPYVYSLVPVERPGLGTMAVDRQGRMYFDPEWCETLTLEQGGYVVLHESLHLILRHCHRVKGIIGDNPTPQECRDLNIAFDVIVWEFMESIKEMCPEGGVTFDTAKAKWPEIERNMVAEQLYDIISGSRKQPEFDPPGNPLGKPPPGEEKNEQPKDGGDQPSNEDGDTESETEDGDGGDKSDGGDQEVSGKSRGKGGSGESEGEGSGDEVEDDGFKLIGDGSAADNQPRDYEEEGDPTWDAFREDRLLELVEKKIEELENDREWQGGRGTIPAGLKRLIKEKLRPQPNPWERLRATVAKCAANHRGTPDYTYSRPNRRQQACADMPRLKGTKKYSPKAVVIVDTSGSMTAGCLAKALVVIKQGLQALGQVPVVCCDARVQQDKVLTAVHSEFELVGGGGTDMRIPLAYTQEKYKPDVTVLVTDTGTPWPDRPIRGQLIVASTQDGFVPPWATNVRIPDSPNKETLDG